MTETFNILHPNPYGVGQVPLLVRFHVSQELFEDDGITAETIATLLHDDLVLAIQAHREANS